MDTGTELWLKSLKWGGAKKFGTATRMPLYVGTPGSNTGAFYKSYQNLAIFYIMNAGHMVGGPCTDTWLWAGMIPACHGLAERDADSPPGCPHACGAGAL